MAVSTTGAESNPTARTLILKGVGPDGGRFALDGGSAKARDLAQRPFAALPLATVQGSLTRRAPSKAQPIQATSVGPRPPLVKLLRDTV
jgi:pyridoxine/pyridoxamine 5'-phosphate oxidase